MQFDLFDADRNRIVGATTYAEFAERLRASDCQRCALGKTRTHIVVDRGNPAAKVLVIGEGPGGEEDAQGKAFVGRAGKLLDSIMAAIGLDTNRDLLIANVVKCRPPENRAPRTEEARACLPFLQKQIALVGPRLVCLLGATALKHLDPDRPEFAMGDEAGKLLSLAPYPRIPFMVLYHPAALLYNAGLKPAMWEHVKALRRWLEQEGLHPSPRGAPSSARLPLARA